MAPATKTIQVGDALEFTNSHGSNTVTISSNVGTEIVSQAITAGSTFIYHFLSTGVRTITAVGGVGTCVVTVTA